MGKLYKIPKESNKYINEGELIMNYDIIIDLNNVTLEECVDLYEKKSIISIINDGRIINFEKEINYEY